MNTFDNIQRFLKSGIPIYNHEVSDVAGRKTRTQAITKRFAFHANAIIKSVRVRLAVQGLISCIK